MKKAVLSVMTLLIVLLVACAPTQQPNEARAQTPPPPVTPPPPAEEAKEEQTLERVVEEVEEEEEALSTGVPEEIQALLVKESAKSLSYSYQGPETDQKHYTFYVKGNDVRYLPDLAQKSLDREETITAIYVDKEKKTAASYCDKRQCVYPGKKEDLVYEDANIFTPYDWRLGITSAKQVGQEKIERRATLKVETNRGIMWLDSFYGIPLRVEADGNLYEFQEMSFNDVKDEDVIYSP